MGETRGRKQPDSSIGAVLRGVLSDIDAWAEGDVAARDGELLSSEDLAAYLANELTPGLMKLYSQRRQYHAQDLERIEARIAYERRQVAAVKRGEPVEPSGERGRPRKTRCIRNHVLAGNRTTCGDCRLCKRLRDRLSRAAE